MSRLIFAYDPGRRTNAQAIVDARTLGYLGDRVLDVTYGRGSFWKEWQPLHLVTSDLDPDVDADHHWDFRAIPLQSWDGDIVYDPPYGYIGTNRGERHDRYGLVSGVSHRDRNCLLVEGFIECARLLGRGRYLLAKCQDQVVAAKKRWQTHLLASAAEPLGLRLVDEIHVSNYGNPLNGRRQQHTAANVSTLQIYKHGRTWT